MGGVGGEWNKQNETGYRSGVSRTVSLPELCLPKRLSNKNNKQMADYHFCSVSETAIVISNRLIKKIDAEDTTVPSDAMILGLGGL